MAVTASYIETPPVVSLQGNPCVIGAGSSLANATDIYMHLRIQELVAGAWTDTAKEDSLPLVAGYVEFDVSGYLEDEFLCEFAFPEHQSNLVIPRPGMIKPFRVKIWETYLDASGVLQDKIADAFQLNQTLYMLSGGISDDDWAVLNENNTDWWTEHQASGRALNWLPAAKTIAPDSVEKLYWIQAAAGTLTLRYAYVYTSGASGTHDYAFSFPAYTPCEICASPAILEEITGKTIASFTVSLVSTAFSQAYIIDRKYHEWSEHFILANSFKCYETLWCRGARTGKIDYTREKYEKTDRRALRIFDRTSGNTKTEFTRVHEINTGFVTETWWDWVTDLLNSDDAYHLKSGGIFPIVLNSESIDFEDQLADELHGLTFEYQYARKSKFFSRMDLLPEKIIPPYFSELSAWFYKRAGGKLIDAIAGREAQISGANLVFPEITGSDVMDFSDATFWNNSLLTAWYNAGAPRTCPITFMDGSIWAEAGKDTTHARLFHQDYTSKVTDILPILVYNNNLSLAKQQAVIDWLKWYFVLFQDGAVLTENNNILIQ